MFHFCFHKCKLSFSHASCSNCIYPYQARNYFSDIISGRNSLWLWSQHIVTSRSAYKVCCSSYYSVTIRVPSNLTVLLSDIQPCLYVSAIAFFLHLPFCHQWVGYPLACRSSSALPFSSGVILALSFSFHPYYMQREIWPRALTPIYVILRITKATKSSHQVTLIIPRRNTTKAIQYIC